MRATRLALTQRTPSDLTLPCVPTTATRPVLHDNDSRSDGSDSSDRSDRSDSLLTSNLSPLLSKSIQSNTENAKRNTDLDKHAITNALYLCTKRY